MVTDTKVIKTIIITEPRIIILDDLSIEYVDKEIEVRVVEVEDE